jgi:hypothetical protein
MAGGVAPFTYNITGPVNGSNGTGFFDQLPPGNYDYTVNTGGGCDVTGTFVIVPGPPMPVTVAAVDVNCNGACDGSATATTLVDINENISMYDNLNFKSLDVSKHEKDRNLTNLLGLNHTYSVTIDGVKIEEENTSLLENAVNNYASKMIQGLVDERADLLLEQLGSAVTFNDVSLTKLKSLTADINVEAMEKLDKELADIALAKKLGVATKQDIARAEEILTNVDFAKFQDFADAIKIVGDAVSKSADNVQSWNRNFMSSDEIVADMLKNTTSQTEVEKIGTRTVIEEWDSQNWQKYENWNGRIR